MVGIDILGNQNSRMESVEDQEERDEDGILGKTQKTLEEISAQAKGSGALVKELSKKFKSAEISTGSVRKEILTRVKTNLN